jgi:hypothetical protein
MRNSKQVRLGYWLLIVLIVISVAVFARNAGQMLVVDSPQQSDVILVLAGETDSRPTLALELLRRGYGRRVLIDVPVDAKVYAYSQVELAKQYIRDLPEGAVIQICPIQGLSTKEESHNVTTCLGGQQVPSILIVTSDFHTRRALSIFRHEVRGIHFSIAAAHDNTQFGTPWWSHRQWAKTCFAEWTRVIWWNVVDRWP